MRPIQLSVKGFTCFRDQVVLDFTGLDLFAITGPTGSGKSSLIDAMIFALYGKSPRAEKTTKDCIALGMPAAEIGFEFFSGLGADRQRYQIARALKRVGTPAVQLYQQIEGKWENIASGDRIVNERITRIVGLDFNGFTRAVVLPQNEFHRFLAGNAEERRKVLDDLLNLDVYERIRKRADDLRKQQVQDATMLKREIEEHYADATEEMLTRLTTEKAEADDIVVQLRQELEVLDEAVRIAADLATARTERAQTVQEVTGLQADHAAAAALLQDGQGRLAELDRLIAEAQAKSDRNTYDDALFAILNRGLPIANDIARRGKELESLLPQTEAARARATQAQQTTQTCEAAKDAAEAELIEAEAQLSESRRQDAAAALRIHLHDGDECPVCLQLVPTVPQVAHPGLEAAEQRAKAAIVVANQTRKALTEAQVAATKAAGAVDSLDEQVARCLDEQSARNKELGGLLPDLPHEVNGITALIHTQERARDELLAAKQELDRYSLDRKHVADRMDASRRDVDTLNLKLAEAKTRTERAEQLISAAVTQLEAAAATLAWPELKQAATEGEPGPLIGARRGLRRSEQETAIGLAARLESEVDRVQRGIPLRKEKAEQAEALEAQAAVSQDLTKALSGKKFLTYVEEAALKVLAQDGSARLEELSGGRYSFDVREHEFLVVDHWNADETRGVSTLSGGETFLASLGLAEALAERLPDLAVGRGRSSLESLFIDEGFGALDEQSLDGAAQALESLRAKNRLVCIITHVRQLAERMPARINVAKAEHGSAISVA